MCLCLVCLCSSSNFNFAKEGKEGKKEKQKGKRLEGRKKNPKSLTPRPTYRSVRDPQEATEICVKKRGGVSSNTFNLLLRFFRPRPRPRH